MLGLNDWPSPGRHVPRPRKALGQSATLLVVVVVAVTGTLALVLYVTPYMHSIASSATNTSTVCSISGQPGGLFLRVMFTSNLTGLVPVVGARVVATNQPALCGGSPATKQTTLSFTTNSTMWYSLNPENNAGYALSVTYLGKEYSLTASLRPVSVTCASFYLPSGQTNITTTEFQSSC